ncbi:uncharacterized protein K452DRAFT_360696 [Aplosporella prunicola CBS 121167]|uniref:Dolichyl-diphosphooligosaccharide--protein glycosyltransferase subunit WBP1 n=1 Tax=Aplosporella prunicola CBS 121167 TaxID=1176127 RepID=A0A6A6B4E5_9PEZI|nr:uncharacterized protein K452DRAFT_360696 [Aplosporella prunicola CBS 121167]KAF2138930.1 hypothetical protein K452DRAFT_360696 [Aplosporella prunicola CBS 121167]
MRWLLSLACLALLGLASALSFSGPRTLVVLEELADKDKYSLFWADLTSRGFSLDFASPKSESLSLFKHGERAYDHVLLLPPKSKGYGPALSPQLVLDFLNKDGNVMLALAGGQTVSAAVQSTLLELDIHLGPDKTSLVLDHFAHDANSASEAHDVVLVPRPQALKPGVRNFFAGDGVVAVPRAMGQLLANASPLLAPILRAPSTAYTHNPKDADAEAAAEDPFGIGSQLSLVTAFQARNSARFAVLGSAEMLQDKWFDTTVKNAASGEEEKTANREFAAQLTAWTFKEKGVLKVGRLRHWLSEDESAQHLGLNETAVGAAEHNPSIYRIKNKVAFEIEISEWDTDRLVPFHPESADALQLEFSMLSPFHRLTLAALPAVAGADSTIFATQFTTPDQHGIFNFRVNYKRPFLTTVDEKREVTVRHFAHDEWPRSWRISGAWPWVGGIGVTVAGWVGFVALWLYSAPVRGAQGEKKRN